jgi:hypothetical protein
MGTSPAIFQEKELLYELFTITKTSSYIPDQEFDKKYISYLGPTWGQN